MIEISNLSKLYQTKKGLVRALDKVTLSVDEGEFLVLRGHSGSGKTTLLKHMTLTLSAPFLTFLKIPPDWQIGAQGAILIVVLAARAVIDRLGPQQ